jgi:hypothetical protein
MKNKTVKVLRKVYLLVKNQFQQRKNNSNNFKKRLLLSKKDYYKVKII